MASQSRMPDVSFRIRASSSTEDSGGAARHPSVNRRDVTVLKRSSPMESTSSESGAEASVAVGTKRTRGRLDGSEEKYSSPSENGDVCFYLDPMATIVTRAKRLRISDSAVDDRDKELHQSLFLENNQEEPVPQAAIKHTLIIPGLPSLAGLPEELIINVLEELSVGDIMSLRRTSKRLAYVTQAKVVWIKRLCQLVEHLVFTECTVTFFPFQVSSHDLERVVTRPYIFDYRWLRSSACHESPLTSKVLSTGWSKPEDIRLPILLPGGGLLIAACDDGRSSNSSVCLWNLDHGTLKWLPEAQMVAEGRISSMDVKVDRMGSFAFLAILSEKENFATPTTLLHQVDVYVVIFGSDEGPSSFRRIDSFSFGGLPASEVQIYPERGRVIVDLFFTVLFWDYSPINMYAWIITSSRRRFYHRAAYAFTHTHKYLIIADGEDSELRVYNLPPLLIRPTRFHDLVLFPMPPYLVHTLPSFSVSLRFSSDRLVDIATILEIAKPLTLPVTVEAATPAGISMHAAQMGIHTDQGEHGCMRSCSEPSGRGFLFIDAASCDSYLMCSFPIHEISLNVGSSDTFCFTSRDRGDAQEQARSGSSASFGTGRINARPFLAPVQMGGRRYNKGSSNALWVGAMGGISSAMNRDSDSSSPRSEVQNVVLMRSPDHDGSLIILSAMIPTTVDLGPDQSRIADIEQGTAKTVLRIPLHESVEAKHWGAVRVEEASVDELSGRVCLVETTTVMDSITLKSHVRCGLRILEYA